MSPKTPITISIDQTLIHELTGMLPALALESIDIPRVKTELSVTYCDHNTLQVSPENANDHLYLQTSSERFGMYYSKPGNGVCHFVHLQRFAAPGKTLLGADSHTPTAGAVGMLAIGTGGLSITKAMVGEGFRFMMPYVIEVRLSSSLRPGVSAKDIILELLRQLTVKGAVGCALEFTGQGVIGLSVTERSTITNMCTELGATTGIFASDEITKAFLTAQKRENDWVELRADADAVYDRLIEIDLDTLEPLIAMPHMPDKVVPVREIAGKRVDQVFIGSCTNASYTDLVKAAKLLRGKKAASWVSLSMAPGSRQVLEALLADNIVSDYVAADARVLECSCGPCVGAGQAPFSKGVSVRTSNRNFIGRGGTPDAEIFLASPETAAATAVAGVITDPTTLPNIAELTGVREPEVFNIDDSLLLPPPPLEESLKVELARGIGLAPLPQRGPIENNITAVVGLVTGDNITTDDIIPANSEINKFVSNIPKMSDYAFAYYDPEYVRRAKELGCSVIVGGENYGQGSSREHAAIIPVYLGVQAIIAKSFARIHKENLINFGILPLEFVDKRDYEKLVLGASVEITGLEEQLDSGTVLVRVKGFEAPVMTKLAVSEEDRVLLRAGGLLNYLKEKTKR